MTSRLGLLLFSLAVSSACGGVVADIPAARQTILQRGAKWTPTETQRHEALRAIQAELEAVKSSDDSIQARELREILTSKPGYRVQFSGVERHGAQLVVCDFLPRIPDKLEPRNWRTDPVCITDGGTTYWSAEYDVRSRTARVYAIGNG